MSSQPLVSIIIPCYNAEPWLAATIESALAQTWPNCEVIVVDDSSTDGSAAIAEGFRGRGVQTVGIPNGGAAAARNKGISLARGDYFQFLDADDQLAPEKLERQLARLSGEPEAAATCAWARFQSSPSEAVFKAEALWRDFDPIAWLITSWREHTMMATAAWLAPRIIVERVGPWHTSFGRQNPVDDMEYFARVVLASSRVLFCADAKVYYRSNIEGSLSQHRSEAAWTAIFGSFNLTAERLLARTDSPEAKLAVATCLQQLVYESYPAVPALRKAAESRVCELGGTDLQPPAGGKTKILHRLIGWKATSRLKSWSR